MFATLLDLASIGVRADDATKVEVVNPVTEISSIQEEEKSISDRVDVLRAERDHLFLEFKNKKISENEFRKGFADKTLQILGHLGELYGIGYSKFQFAEIWVTSLNASSEPGKELHLQIANSVLVNAVEQIKVYSQARVKLEAELEQLHDGWVSPSLYNRFKDRFRFGLRVFLLVPNVAATLASGYFALRTGEPELFVATAGLSAVSASVALGTMAHLKQIKVSTAHRGEKNGFLAGLARRIIFSTGNVRKWKPSQSSSSSSSSFNDKLGELPPRVVIAKKAPSNLLQWVYDTTLNATVMSCNLAATNAEQPVARAESVEATPKEQ